LNIPQLDALECLAVAKFQNPSPVAATFSALNISERKMILMGIAVIKAHNGDSWLSLLSQARKPTNGEMLVFTYLFR
jgi:hypothetical protein